MTETVIPSIGEPRHDWCPACHRSTLVSHTIYAITSEAAHVIGGYAICEACAYSPYAECRP